MTEREIIKALECCKKAKINQDCVVLKCPFSTEYGCNIGLENLRNAALDLINRQKEEIERLNKNYEELIYKTECLLCHATGNKFSKYTYTTQEMISFVDDYIQDCCDEAVEEAKETVKSEARKEFAEKIDELLERYSAIHNNAKIAMQDEIECVKEMTKVEE